MLDPTVVVFSQARRMKKTHREDEKHAVPEYQEAGIEYPADIHALDLANPGTFRIDPRQHFGGVDGLCPRAKMVLHWATNVRSCWDHIPRGAVALAVSQEPHQDFRLIVLKSLFYRAPKPFDGSALIPWIGPRAK